MSQVANLTDADFKAAIENSQVPVLVDFSATWCQPCKQLAPTIDAVAREYDSRLNVFKVDVEDAPKTATHFGITSVPACLFFRNGREVDRFQGNKDIAAVREHVERTLHTA